MKQTGMVTKQKRMTEKPYGSFPLHRHLNLMTDEEIQFILGHQVGYDPDFLEMVWMKKMNAIVAII